jgi:GNAT superfamily N-acetyltransferase
LPQARSLARADPDWRTSIGKYLRSLTRSGERGRLLVADLQGAVIGVINYDVDVETQSGSIGVSAVHPARQGKGIGTLMYDQVLDAMGAQGVKYATADRGRRVARASPTPLPEARIRRRTDGSLLQALGDSRAGRRRPGTPSGGERTPLRSTRSVSKLLRDPRRPQTAMSPGRVVGSGNSGLPGGVASPARAGDCQSALTRSSECSSASTTTTAGRHARASRVSAERRHTKERRCAVPASQGDLLIARRTSRAPRRMPQHHAERCEGHRSDRVRGGSCAATQLQPRGDLRRYASCTRSL